MNAPDDAAAWQLEQSFWTAGSEHYREALDPACIMAFPEPVGLLIGAAITESLAQAPRWPSVDISMRSIARPGDALLVLGYRASATRRDGPPYEAFCTSTYRASASGWRLVQHQQTPIGARPGAAP